MGLGINIEGSEQFINKLNSKLNESDKLTRDISEQWLFFVDEKFKNEGIPKWHPLAPSTLKQRRKKGYTGKILQRTNMLQSSVMPFHDNTIAGVGTNNPYANAHEQAENPNDFITINIPPRERILRFKTDGKGKLVKHSRIGWDEDDKFLLTFAKKRSKNQVQRKVQSKGHSIKLYKRSFLALQPTEKEFLTGMIIEFLE